MQLGKIELGPTGARVHRLWDELADFEAADTDAALMHALAGVARLIGAQNAFWLGAVRLTAPTAGDPLNGWRPRRVRYLHERPTDRAFVRRSIQAIDRGRPGEGEIALVRWAGSFRAARVRDLLGPRWRSGREFERYRARGLSDALHVVFPVNDSAESYFGFQRDARRPPFTAAERELAAYALRGVKWFHRQVMLSFGLLVARQPLTPRERRIQSLLLTSLSEKEIAHRLGLSAQTTHKYVTDLFRKLGLSGRRGLAALWLGRS